ncbi:MAG TPA: outer membrane lipoprotein LolB [Burkholderiaceae bacterium]|nr:outer membrane lipoprotein LolB [Burkholderiaceae bacterium]
MIGLPRATAFLAALLLAACASVAPPGETPSGETLSGRLVVNVAATPESGARSLNAAFELQGDARVGRLNLSTPLGSMLAQARWSPGNVVLKTPQGERQFTDLDSLTREMMGESLPMAALFDWLRGRPWPGAPSMAMRPPAAAGFEQLGWKVDLARFDQAAVAATRARAPAVTVRAKLEQP